MARPKGPFIEGRRYKDEFDHVRHIAYLRMKAQCKFRSEPFDLTIEEFFELWPQELWSQRGMRAEQLVMVRQDPEGSWTKSNCLVVTRYQQLCRGKKMGKFPGQFEDLKI